jgi:hypothetical protein
MIKDANPSEIQGMIKGFSGGDTKAIVIDQGLNTTAISYKFNLDPDLIETRYILEIDNRLGSIADGAGNVQTPNFIDDDHRASYTFALGTNSNVTQIGSNENDSTVTGPRGTRMKFLMRASMELNSSTYLFTKLGSSSTKFTPGSTVYGTGGAGGGTIYTIDTVVKITGATTGRSVDIPVRFLKYVA